MLERLTLSLRSPLPLFKAQKFNILLYWFLVNRTYSLYSFCNDILIESKYFPQNAPLTWKNVLSFTKQRLRTKFKLACIRFLLG